MSEEEKSYTVTFSAEMTVRADNPDQAVQRAIDAVGGAVFTDSHVRGAHTNRGNFTATEIRYDPEELAQFERWIASFKDQP